jgi:DNA-directed RNA polymerase specialized sigma24 family protein
MPTESDLATAASAADPKTGLRAVRALRRLLEELERTQVLRARRLGWSWQEIGDALDVSRQAVHKKYGREDVS